MIIYGNASWEVSEQELEQAGGQQPDGSTIWLSAQYEVCSRSAPVAQRCVTCSAATTRGTCSGEELCVCSLQVAQAVLPATLASIQYRRFTADSVVHLECRWLTLCVWAVGAALVALCPLAGFAAHSFFLLHCLLLPPLNEGSREEAEDSRSSKCKICPKWLEQIRHSPLMEVFIERCRMQVGSGWGKAACM